MKYIIKNDISSVIKKRSHFIIIYLIVILMLTYISTRFENYNLNIFKFLLGYDIQRENLLSIIMFLLRGSLILLILSNIYFEDIENNCVNLFLRMKKIKWLIYKQISTYLILFLFYIILYLCLLVIGFTQLYIINLFIKQLIITIFIVQFIYINLLLVNDFKYILMFFLILCIIIHMESFNLTDISSVYYLIFSFFFFVLNLILYSKKIIKVIERYQI